MFFLFFCFFGFARVVTFPCCKNKNNRTRLQAVRLKVSKCLLQAQRQTYTCEVLAIFVWFWCWFQFLGRFRLEKPKPSQSFGTQCIRHDDITSLRRLDTSSQKSALKHKQARKDKIFRVGNETRCRQTHVAAQERARKRHDISVGQSKTMQARSSSARTRAQKARQETGPDQFGKQLFLCFLLVLREW